MTKDDQLLNTLIDKVSPVDVLKLEKIESKFVHKTNKDYVLISKLKRADDVIATQDSNCSKDVTYVYSIAMPKLDCRFCFDHELDHIPVFWDQILQKRNTPLYSYDCKKKQITNILIEYYQKIN